ncbi:MAG TPA: DUF4082 domain-containing protein [Chitinophaga sp.]
MLRNSLSYVCEKQYRTLLFSLLVSPLFSVQTMMAASHFPPALPGDTSIFQAADAPATPPVNDGMGGIELGVKFRATQSGKVTGIRFYKAAPVAGNYTVHLWSSAGNKLAEAAFTVDTAKGWQQVAFTTPVTINANTTYVASYFNNTGDYATTNPFFTQAVVNGPLRALANGEDGPNGLYKYSAAPVFPDNNYGSSNYWVDVVFIPDEVPVQQAAVAAPAATTAANGRDTIAPAVSNVKPVTNADGTVSVSWNTNETADATVDYDISAETLKLHADDDKRGTDHSVQIAGLTPGVTYYFRIKSRDAAGNTVIRPNVTAPPLSFTVTTGPCAVDSSAANFRDGGQDVGALVNPNGTITLQPLVNEEFISVLKSIPEGWSGTRYNNDGTTVNNNGVITVNGTHIFSNASFEPGSSIEFAAIFGAGSYQNIGFSSDQPYSDGTWITIGQANKADGNVYARASNNTEIKIGSGLLGTLHFYRIKWNATNFEFFVDNDVKPAATISLKVATNMYIQVSDFVSSDEGLSIDWMHVAPYAASGSFTSRVFDAGAPTNWGAVNWHGETPAGTAIGIAVTTGDTPNPNDGTWSSFVPVKAPGTAVNSSSRYIQYKATLTTTDKKITPVLKGVSINCSGNSNMAEKVKETLQPSKPTQAASNGKLDVKVAPNPSSDYFSLAISGPADKPIMVNILDAYGRIVEHHQKVMPFTSLQVGESLSPGTYYVELLLGSQRKTAKIVKVK